MILTVTVHPALDKIIRLPRLRPNDSVRARIEMEYGGGKGNNVARTLTRLGLPVVATGFQGGYTGEFVSAKFAQEGIRTAFVPCRAPTRTSLMIVEEESGLTYAIYEPGQKVESQERENLWQRFVSLLEEARFVLLCGSGQTPDLAGLIREMIHYAQSRGVRCGLDSSGLALQEGVKAKPYLLKVNREELSELVGKPLVSLEDQIEALLALNRGGITLTALTRGREGLLLSNGTLCLEGVLVMDNVVNVMGCGDSLLAGIVSALWEGADLESVVRRGVACGAANTQAIGAGFIDPHLARNLEKQVAIRQVKI